jgi:hypothetical protein
MHGNPDISGVPDIMVMMMFMPSDGCPSRGYYGRDLSTMSGDEKRTIVDAAMTLTGESM